MDSINQYTQKSSPYFLKRPYSPKQSMSNQNSAKNLSLTMSIGANCNSNNFMQLGRVKSID